MGLPHSGPDLPHVRHVLDALVLADVLDPLGEIGKGEGTVGSVLDLALTNPKRGVRVPQPLVLNVTRKVVESSTFQQVLGRREKQLENAVLLSREDFGVVSYVLGLRDRNLERQQDPTNPECDGHVRNPRKPIGRIQQLGGGAESERMLMLPLRIDDVSSASKLLEQANIPDERRRKV